VRCVWWLHVHTSPRHRTRRARRDRRVGARVVSAVVDPESRVRVITDSDAVFLALRGLGRLVPSDGGVTAVNRDCEL